MFEILLGKIARALDNKNITYMVIGGQAVLLHGSPRLTRDIDITLGAKADQLPLLVNICKGLKLKPLPQNIEQFAKETNVLPAEDQLTHIRVDFIFSYSPYEQQAMKRAQPVLLDGYQVKFATAEDIIIHKMLAHRAIDLSDIKSILIKNQKKIDLTYIDHWLKKFSKLSEHKRIANDFKKLAKESHYTTLFRSVF